MIAPHPAALTAAAWFLFGTFVSYLLATIFYLSGFIGTRISQGARFLRVGGWAANAHGIGVLLHLLAILARWYGSGYFPASNMYEFIGFMAFCSMLAFQVINRIYQMHLLGGIVSPIGLFLLAYSYVFPPKVQPLIPALKSYWLPMHVSLAALSEGFFAVAFGAALLYLLRVRGLELAAAAGQATPAGPALGAAQWEERWGRRGMELLFYGILVMTGFTVLALFFRYLGFQWLFDTATYHLPPIIGPFGEGVGTHAPLFGFIPMPLLEAPWRWRGKNLNTLLYALAIGGVLYWAIRRYLAKGPIGDWLAGKVTADPEVLDEISYRAVAIGYPVFTLGGLIFAMLWANEAWGSYWFWDPKETWALIAWLVYSAYLHLRITRGWEGRRSAWVALIGFGVILFTLIGVNLLIVGIHSYVGGDM